MLGLGALVALLAIASSYMLSLQAFPLLPVQSGDAIVVTGSSSGIGRHAALSLAKEGFTVFACVRKQKDGEALLQSAELNGVDKTLIKILILDVTKPDDVARGVETVSAFVGERGLCGLFNNAGTGGEASEGTISTSVEFSDMALFHKVMNVNYFGVVEVTRAFLSLIRKGKGRIIMNASVQGYIASPFFSSYAASKHAVEGFSDSLRREMAPLGVKVSILECGFISTPILNGYIPPSKEPYVDEEKSFWRGFWKESLDAPTPKVSSEAVIHAMRAEKPKKRYVVGKNAGILKLIRFVPPDWIDFLIGAGDNDISDEQLEQLSKQVRTDIKL